MMFKTVLLLTVIFVSGCAVTSTAPDFCSVYRPVPTLYCGTAMQQLTTDQNNAVYMKLCGG